MKLIRIFVLFTTSIILWYSCADHDLFEPEHELQIRLRWIKSYPTETKNDIVTGLLWSLSFLGAELPGGSKERAIVWDGERTFRLDLVAAGFTPAAQQPLRELLTELKNS